MSKYCYVVDSVVQGDPRPLPDTWKDPVTGVTYGNFSSLSDSDLLLLGWYPYVETDPGQPGMYYNKTYSAFVVGATTVDRDVIWVPWDIELVKQDKNNKLKEQLSQCTANELAVDDKVPQKIKNEEKWLMDSQSALARLTDWQETADFDVVMPSPLVLPNNYVAASYVDQGLALSAKNAVARDAQLTEPWNQTKVDALITANQAAAADSSGATAPTEPDFDTRQGIVVPGEQNNWITIYREAREDANPAWRTTYKMRMLNRQDSRDIQIFSYTGAGTYLTWHKFVDVSAEQDGSVWGLEAHSSEWQYVPDDMEFIFSYGTHPTETKDYFTKPVKFPAGVSEMHIYVAWDTE